MLWTSRQLSKLRWLDCFELSYCNADINNTPTLSFSRKTHSSLYILKIPFTKIIIQQTNMRLTPVGSASWVLSYTSIDYHSEPWNGNIGVYTTEEAPEFEIYRFLKVKTQDVLLNGGFEEPTNVDVVGGRHWSHEYEKISQSMVELSVEWKGHFLWVRYERLIMAFMRWEATAFVDQI